MTTQSKAAKSPAGTQTKRPVSDARRAANIKWDRENMVTIACRVTKKRALEFKEACEQLGTTRNAVLLQAIVRAIEEANEKSGK